MIVDKVTLTVEEVTLQDVQLEGVMRTWRTPKGVGMNLETPYAYTLQALWLQLLEARHTIWRRTPGTVIRLSRLDLAEDTEGAHVEGARKRFPERREWYKNQRLTGLLVGNIGRRQVAVYDKSLEERGIPGQTTRFEIRWGREGLDRLLGEGGRSLAWLLRNRPEFDRAMGEIQRSLEDVVGDLPLGQMPVKTELRKDIERERRRERSLRLALSATTDHETAVRLAQELAKLGMHPERVWRLTPVLEAVRAKERVEEDVE